jgi:molybdopterin synthase sulfur carrier subunit
MRVTLPAHLLNLAGVAGPIVEVDVAGTPTVAAVLDALERDYPALRGTIRDHRGGTRRAFIRFFAGSRDLSNDPLDAALPAEVASGDEPLRIIGAIAGG